METFRTSYRRDFGWPWELPVVLSAWKPPERTPRAPAAPAAPATPCCSEGDLQNHATVDAGLRVYQCLADKEARLHHHCQAAGQRRARTKLEEEAGRGRRSQLVPGGEEWLSIYASDFTQKDMVPRLNYVGLLKELVSEGVPRAPLGRSLFAAYTDPTRFRRSAHTVQDTGTGRSMQWYSALPPESEYTVSLGLTAERSLRKCQPFKYPLLSQHVG